MFSLFLFNFMFLLSQNVNDKIGYQYQQEYINNVIYNFRIQLFVLPHQII